jgi:hypothetical protein
MEISTQHAQRAPTASQSASECAPALERQRRFLSLLREAVKNPDTNATEMSLLKNAPALLAQASGTNSGQSVSAGEVWPTGTGADSLSNRFRQATPPELRDLGPQGMELSLEADYNVDPPTRDARHAAGDMRRMTLGGTISLSGRLLDAYLSGRGENQQLPDRDMNSLVDILTGPSSDFMGTQAKQIDRDIRAHIQATGETSGRIRAVTDWTTTLAEGFGGSLGLFSGKLLYDLEYSLQPDGAIEVSGKTALAVQDLYDFGEKMLPTPVPVFLLPRKFTQRENHLNEIGSLTDTAFATLQREGIASPFYVYGVSPLAEINMTLPRGGNNRWEVSR